jgi:hypothetical protein
VDLLRHGRPTGGPAGAQARAQGLNKRIAGCVLDRDVRGLIEASGLELTSLRTYYDAHSPKPAGYFYEERAAA